MIHPAGIATTATGQPIDLMDPGKTRIYARDLYPALAVLTRYAGQLNVPVLRHAYLCLLLAEHRHPGDHDIAAAAATHDDGEAYYGELPFFWTRAFPELKAIKHAWDAHLCRAHLLPWPRPPAFQARLDSIDSRAVAIEAVVWEHAHADHHQHHHGGNVTAAERELGLAAKTSRVLAMVCRIREAIVAAGGRLVPEVPEPGLLAKLQAGWERCP